MTTLSKIAFLIAVLACSAAQAAEPLTVDVAGRIAATNSCVPTITRNNFSYGVIKASELNRDKPTRLPSGQQVFDIRVECQAPVNQLFLSFIDHKEADAVRDTAVLHHDLCSTPECGDAAFGVGRDKQDRKIGGLFLWTNGGSINNHPANWTSYSKQQSLLPIFRHGIFWPRHGNGLIEYSPAAVGCEGAAGAEENCFAGKRFVIPIYLHTIVDSKDRDITDDMQIDGAFTIEIRTI